MPSSTRPEPPSPQPYKGIPRTVLRSVIAAFNEVLDDANNWSGLINSSLAIELADVIIAIDLADVINSMSDELDYRNELDCWEYEMGIES